MTEPGPSRNLSEWLKILLEEIERKKVETARAREEQERRATKPGDPQER